MKKSASFRITPVRTCLLELFSGSHVPQTATTIHDWLSKAGLYPNKTTVYREIDFLIEQGIIQSVDFGDGKKRWEKRDLEDHHHHLICEKCETVQDVHLATSLAVAEDQMLKDAGFVITRHMLEFFGLCAACQPNKGTV